jgi:hypothetical protein
MGSVDVDTICGAKVVFGLGIAMLIEDDST